MLHTHLSSLALAFALLSGLHLVAASYPRNDTAVTGRSTILYHKDGNWDAHFDRSSAILFFDRVSRQEAVHICGTHGERLIEPSDRNKFDLPLQYQAFLGTISQEQRFWPATLSRPLWLNVDSVRSFICTNAAPLIDSVDVDFNAFPTVHARSNGTIYNGVRDHMGFRFQGVPYALQPVGENRLAYPVQWYTNDTESVVNAISYGPACPTSAGHLDNNTNGVDSRDNPEACLVLNIFTPYLPGAGQADLRKQKPVMFWVPDGSTTPQAAHDGTSLSSRSDVVVVSANVRGGELSRLDFDDGLIDGNYGVADLVSALQWVQDHVGNFGGDPERVTIFGQGLGGDVVTTLIASSKAEGLFHAAISQDAPIRPATTVAKAVNASVHAVGRLCEDVTGAARLGCLRNLTLAQMMSISQVPSEGGNDINLDASIDGIWVSNDDLAAANARQLNRIHYMAGSTLKEGQTYSYYHNNSRAQDSSDQRTSHDRGSSDPYGVFGNGYIFNRRVRGPKDISRTTLQQDMWGSFARTFDPNPTKEYLEARGYNDSLAVFERFSWPQYNRSRRAANLDYPAPSVGDLPWADKCKSI